MAADRPSEFDLIARLFAPLTRGAAGAFGLTDDAALLDVPSGQQLVVTKDALVEGVHFFATDPPELIARKALRVNLSDLAAKGAEPSGYLLALMLPASCPMEWLTAFAAGLADDGEAFKLPLLGGDTTATPGPLALSVTAFGLIPAGQMLRRAGAAPGDLVFVSGTIGDAGGGLECISRGLSEPTPLIMRYRLPQPRLALGQRLRGVASAALDVSDGLLADLGHIARTSGVRLVIEAQRLPLSQDLCGLWGKTIIERAVTAGDDYEIAFTVAPGRRAAVLQAAAMAGVQVTEIGRVEAGEGAWLLDPIGRRIPLTRTGWTHF